MSRGLKERAGAIRSARERLSARLGREPALSELAEETGLEPEEIAAAEEANLPVASLQMETGDGFTLESVLGTEGWEEAIVERRPCGERWPPCPSGNGRSSCCATSGYDPGSDRQGAGSLPGAGLPHRTQGRGAPAPQAGVGAAYLAPLA